mgnify:CR=1 FL=1
MLANALLALLVTTVLKVVLNSQQVFAMLVITVQQDKLHHSQPYMFVQLEAIVKSDLVNQHLVDQATTIHQQE